MKPNMKKGERVFRVIVGLLVIIAFYIPYSRWLLWFLAIVLLLTGLTGQCYLNKMMK